MSLEEAVPTRDYTMRLGRDADISGADTERPPKKFVRYFLLTVGCVGYALAKSMASGGTVTIGRTEFLLFGMVPFLVIAAYARLFFKSSELALWRIALAWIYSLAVYVIFQGSLLFENIRVTLSHAGYVQAFWINVTTACSVVVLGVLCAAATVILKNRSIFRATPRTLGVPILNFAMFYLFVFLIPPSI